LEFLGDAVLEMAVSENLYAAFPDSTEGEMTNLRQRYVAKPPLEKAAEKLGIVKYLLYYGGAADNVGKKAK
ncbi:MAG TPA: ribonuclease III, partial [Clostridiales bacterium]|nr:ribonuclease III [Clostridiales bacterium]